MKESRNLPAQIVQKNSDFQKASKYTYKEFMNKKEKPVLTVENYILNWKYTCNDFIVENSGFSTKSASEGSKVD